MERRLALGILSTAGVLVAHEFAYTLVSLFSAAVTTGGDHSYLGLLWSLFGPLAGLAVGRLAIQRVRKLDLGIGVSTQALWLVLLILFLLLETGERALSGHGALSAFTEPAVLVGIALSGPVAYLFQRLIDVAVLALGPDAPRSAPRLPRSPGFLWAPLPAPTRAGQMLRLHYCMVRRGPPGLS